MSRLGRRLEISRKVHRAVTARLRSIPSTSRRNLPLRVTYLVCCIETATAAFSQTAGVSIQVLNSFYQHPLLDRINPVSDVAPFDADVLRDVGARGTEPSSDACSIESSTQAWMASTLPTNAPWALRRPQHTRGWTSCHNLSEP